MAFDLIAFDVLAVNITQSITSLLEHHHLPTTDIKKNIKALKDEDRSIQCQFLLRTIELLRDPNLPKQYKDQSNIILNAAVYFVYFQIGQSYNWISPDRSSLYSSLRTSLNLTKENNPNTDDEYRLYTFLEKFLYAQTFRTNTDGKPDPSCGYLEKPGYSKIRAYYIESDLRVLADKIKSLKEKKIAAAQENKNKNKNPSPISSTESISSSIGSGQTFFDSGSTNTSLSSNGYGEYKPPIADESSIINAV